MERGGKTLARQLQNPNPTATKGCSKPKCIPCGQPGGSRSCHTTNVTYQYTCKECEAVYTGETSRNLYTRAQEQQKKYEVKAGDSFINNHQVESHNSSAPNFKWFSHPLWDWGEKLGWECEAPGLTAINIFYNCDQMNAR